MLDRSRAVSLNKMAEYGTTIKYDLLQITIKISLFSVYKNQWTKPQRRGEHYETVLMVGHKIFSWRNVANYPLITPVTPSYLEHS